MITHPTVLDLDAAAHRYTDLQRRAAQPECGRSTVLLRLTRLALRVHWPHRERTSHLDRVARTLERGVRGGIGTGTNDDAHRLCT